jgi:hypothetical protein
MKYKIVKCAFCGKKFLPKKGGKCCSKNCYSSFSHQKKRVSKIYIKNCINCGAEFSTIDYRKNVCSKFCQKEIQRIYRKNYKENKKHPVMIKVCDFCKKEFETRDVRKKCCSKQCSSAKCRVYRPHKTQIKKCEECGKEFLSKRIDINCCSIDCRKKAKKKTTSRWDKESRSILKYRIASRLRNRILRALKKGYKSGHSIELLGCSIEFLKTYLENLFEEGMTWENWSRKGWHMDHIIPCASFDLTKEEEQKKCFHYTNLQPLWAKDNLEKHTKLNWSKR